MGFFDDAPPSLDEPGQWAPWDLPRPEFPRVAVAEPLVLARTGEVAVAVTAIWAYTTGFEFWVRAQFRESGPALEREPDDESLHLGVEFADGRKVVNTGRSPGYAESVPDGLILRPVGFGGGWRYRNRSYWVAPLPPAGPVTFACEWAACGITEELAVTDADLILEAASRSVVLWPE